MAMASSVTPRRRRRVDEPNDSSSEDSPDALQTNKRPRGGSEVHSSLSPSYPSLEEHVKNNGLASGPWRGPEASEHQPGSIIRVKLANFVTYTAVEIFPGPSLNMVIGPNGTGKSTLVCAICLGLGWPPKYLGRQKEYSEFVKNGERHGSVEIELRRAANKSKNPVIRCELRRDGNRADFFINNRPCKAKQVQHLAQEFSIQIDNLCQFLPQDKVVEFAAMTPTALLRSTQEAVAAKRMLKWHDDLKLLRSEQREKEKSRLNYQEALKNLEGRQRMQEADVARMREREQVKENVRLWKSLRPFAEYLKEKTLHEADKASHSAAIEALESLKKDVEPTLRAANDRGIYRDLVKAAATAKHRSVEKHEQDFQFCFKKLEEFGSKVTELQNAIEAEKKNYKSRQQDRVRIMNSCNETRRKMEEAAPEFDAAYHNDRISNHNRRIDEKNDEVNEISRNIENLKDSAQQKAFALAKAKKELASLDTRAGQQAMKLSRTSPDALRIWEYIKEHVNEFEKPVYGPPIVECSVKDARYVSLLESLFQATNFLAVTTQTKSDFNRIHDVVYNELGLRGVPVREITNDLRSYPAPASVEDMKAYGFDCWAVDCMQGPEPVLAMLCEDIKLHQAGLSLQDTSADQYRSLENSSISSWATERSVYRIARRKEYGPGAVSTTVRDTRPAQYWNAQPVDIQAKKSIERQMVEWNGEQVEMQQELQACMNKRHALWKEIETLNAEKKAFTTEKEDAKKAEFMHRSLPIRLEQFERKRSGIEDQMKTMQDRIFQQKNEANKYLLGRAQTALDYSTTVERMYKVREEALEIEMMLIEASSDHGVLLGKNETVRNQLQEKELQVKELDQSQRESKKRAASIAVDCKRVHGRARDDSDQGLLDFIMNHRASETTLEEVVQNISAEEAQLSLMHDGGSGRIIEEFEEREKKISDYKQRLTSLEDTIQQIEENIITIRSKWEPELDSLVKSISDSFAFNMKQINCAGEVNVHKEDDFDRWAVSIKVKFREEEDLTQLDSHRQSGGERAVSTIFYLMSLQSLTRSPFRVVDEINQGMDPRNERLVHSRMVAIATGNDEWLANYNQDHADMGTNAGTGKRGLGDDTDIIDLPRSGVKGSQYFLITPKLLHGLRYEPGMKVLCIASGEFMPENQAKASFAKSLAIRRSLKVIPAASQTGFEL